MKLSGAIYMYNYCILLFPWHCTNLLYVYTCIIFDKIDETLNNYYHPNMYMWLVPCQFNH